MLSTNVDATLNLPAPPQHDITPQQTLVYMLRKHRDTTMVSSAAERAAAAAPTADAFVPRTSDVGTSYTALLKIRPAGAHLHSHHPHRH